MHIENDLSIDVWRILRISELRVEVETEVGIVVDLLVAEQNDLSASGAFDVFSENIVDDGVDVVVDVLEEAWKAVLDAKFQLLEEVRVVERQNLHVVFGLAFLDPAHRLHCHTDMSSSSSSTSKTNECIGVGTISPRPLAARCCRLANDLTNFTGDKQTNEETDRQPEEHRRRVKTPHLRGVEQR